MLWLPMVIRELREQSRRPWNHVLRALGALSLLLVTLHILRSAGVQLGWGGPAAWRAGGGTMFVAERGVGAFDWVSRVLERFEGKGGQVFTSMNVVLLATIGLVGPLLTADCLSRERREGTLGLLFLTPLKPADVVFAKLVTHGLRATQLFLGAIPVLALPVLLGGLSWMEVVRAVLVDAGALVLALTAGMWASTRWQGSRAVLAGALMLMVVTGAVWLVGWGLLQGLRVWVGRPDLDLIGELLRGVWQRFLLATTTLKRLVAEPWSLWLVPLGRPITRMPQLAMPAAVLVLAGVLAFGVFRRAANGVAKAQREGRPRGRAEQVEEALAGRMVFRRALEWVRAAAMTMSPHLWIEMGSWRMRVVPWAMAFGGGLLEVWSHERFFHGPNDDVNVPWLVLRIATAFLASSAFQRDRTSGALELALTAPKGEGMLLRGKLLALVIQVLPACLLMLLVESWFGWAVSGHFSETFTEGLLELGGQVLLGLAVGVYCSVVFRSFVAAFVVAVGIVEGILFVRAVALGTLAGILGERPPYETPLLSFCFVVSAGLIAWGCLRFLYATLKRRSFAVR